MALITVSFFSRSLSRPTEFYMILPNDMPAPNSNLKLPPNPHYNHPTKTLVLLHGYSGINRDWLQGSPVQELALKYNLAIVMPSGENSFYLDAQGTGRGYGTLMGEELVDYLRRTFQLALKPEDTFIGGYSMGGFGALHTALAYPHNYSKLIALSSALIIHQVAAMTPEMDNDANIMADYNYYASTFGDPKLVEDSDNNPEVLIRKLKESGAPIPGIYIACGTEDFLIEPNREFHTFLKTENVPHVYEEAPGVHDWKFWNSCIEPAIRWVLV